MQKEKNKLPGKRQPGETKGLTNVLVTSIISYMSNHDKRKAGSDERMTADVEANKEFGRRVKRRLLDVGMTSRELAELLGIKPREFDS